MRFRHAVWMTLSMATATALATTVAVQKLDSDLNKQVQPFQPWVVQCLQNLPLKTVTSCWTWLGNRNLPPALREPTYRGYCSVFGCNVEEASEPLSNYQNLQQFFARSLKPGARVFQQHATLNAPSDGTVVNCGKIVNEQVEQVSVVHLVDNGNTLMLLRNIGKRNDLETDAAHTCTRLESLQNRK
jgi:hypothetical protein